MFLTGSLQCPLHVGIGLTDDVVEGCPRKVTKEDSLRVGLGLQPVDGVEQRMMAVGGEAGCQRRDVYQEVGLYDDLSRRHPVCLHVAVQQVELHALAQHLTQIAEVAALLGRRIVYRQFAVITVGHYQLGIETSHHHPDVLTVDAQSLLSRLG